MSNDIRLLLKVLSYWNLNTRISEQELRDLLA